MTDDDTEAGTIEDFLLFGGWSEEIFGYERCDTTTAHLEAKLGSFMFPRSFGRGISCAACTVEDEVWLAKAIGLVEQST